MKILLIDNFFYRRGGAEVVMLNTGELLKSHGHSVIYFSRNWDKNIDCENKEYFCSGIDPKTKCFWKKISGVKNYFYNFEASRNLKKLLIKEKPDVVHIHIFWGGLSPSIFSVIKKCKIPIIHSVHDYRMVCPAYTFKNGKDNVCEECESGKFYKCVINKCSKGSIILSIIMMLEMYFRNILFHPVQNIDHLIYVSKFAEKIHLKHDARFKHIKSSVMYNFSDYSLFNSLSDSITQTDGYYLFYGRLSYEKGISTLINVFRQYPNLHLKIVGTGPLENMLKQKCIDSNISNVEFVGFKNGKELFEIVKRAKFVCVPSEWYENNPMTIIESYTLSVPVIGASIGGISEIIEDGKTGFLFESGSENSLISSINKAENLSENEYMIMKNNTLLFANQNFNPEKYYNELVDLYSNIIKGTNN